MTPLKLARIKTCNSCGFHKASQAWPWPRCGVDARELNDDAFDGPASDCPEGRWEGIVLSPSAILENRYAAAPKRVFAPDPAAEARKREVARRFSICDACTVNPNCIFKTCKPCRKTALLSRPGMACPHDPPQWLPFAPEGKRIKVVWTISVHNEPLVGETVREIMDSVAGGAVEIEIVVVDDASTDDSCRGLPCRVIRNSSPRGIGFNLNLAAAFAVERLGADVVGVADAHMKVPAGCLEAVARRALEEICITSSAAFGWEESSGQRQWGAYLVKTKRDLVAAKWMGARWPAPDGSMQQRPAQEWGRVQVPLGAFYAYSRDTISRLSAPTGRLWETVVGRWGFLLEPMAMKCELLGVPVYVSRDHHTRHLYRRKNPVPGAHIEKIRNVAFATGALFTEGTRRRFIDGWLASRKYSGGDELAALGALGAAGVRRPWTGEEEEELLMAIPEIESEKRGGIPLEKIMLAARRDKMMAPERVAIKAHDDRYQLQHGTMEEQDEGL